MKHIISATAAVAVMAAGCGHSGHGTSETRPHNDELTLTAYTDSFEYFVRCHPLVAGEETDMEVYLSGLPDMRAAGGRHVSLSLDGAEAAEGHAHGDGIYHFTINPGGAGEKRLKISSGVAGQDVSIPVTVYTDHESAEKVVAPKSPYGINFAKEMGWKVDFATDTVRTSQLGEVVKVTAIAEPAPGSRYTVTAPAGGTVIFSDVKLTPGSPVRAGQVLARLDGNSTMTGSVAVSLADARSTYELATADYERKSQLATDGIVAQSEVLQARSDYQKAKAAYEHLQKRFVGAVTLASPVSGHLTALYAANGSHVAEGEAVAEISTDADIVLRAEVSPRHSDVLGHLADAMVQLPGGEVVSVNGCGGSVRASLTTTQGETLLPVTLHVPGTGGMASGTHTTVWLKGAGDTGVAVPRDAIVEEMGQKFVFVQLTPEYFERRPVTAGVTDGRMVRIESGLNAGERIVTRGAVMVSLAEGAAAIDPHAGHNH